MKTLIDLRKTAFTYEGPICSKSIEMERLISAFEQRLISMGKAFNIWENDKHPYHDSIIYDIEHEYLLDLYLRRNEDIFFQTIDQEEGGIIDVYNRLVKEFFKLFEVPSLDESIFTFSRFQAHDITPLGILSLSTISFLAGKFSDIYRTALKFFNNNYNFFTDSAYRGADILNVHWSNIWNIMIGSVNTLYHTSVSDAIHQYFQDYHPKNGKIIRSITKVGKAGIAIAEYAYGRINSPRIQKVIINPLQNCPIPQYNKKNDCLFNVGKGLRGVVGIATSNKNKKIMGINEDIIIVGYAGTSMRYINNILTDIVQILNAADSVYFASVGVIDTIKVHYPNYRIVVFGHSLGGGLSQFSVAALNDKRISSYGYNSAGLSRKTLKYLPSKLSCKINHYLVDKDPISRFGKLLGNIVIKNSIEFGLKAHAIKNVNNVYNKKQTVYCTV